MNKIEEMIKELCPNGVEWKKLGEICGISTGKGITKKDEVLNGKYPIISGGITPMGYYNSFNRNANTITVSRVGANAGYVNFITCNFYLNDKCFSVIPIDEKNGDINVVYLYHYLKYIENNISELQSEGGVPTINTTKLSSISIPLPPLPIQTEIVRILDKFVEQQEQLEKLIELRKKQYEYYREELLKPKEGEKWEKVIMSDVCDLKAGKAISASELNDSNAYPCYGGNGIRGYISKYSHEGNFAIIGRQGALCGCVNWATKKFYATEHAVVVTPKNGNDSRFLYLLFTRANLNQYKSSGAQPGLAVNKLNELYFTIPSSKKQKQIVKILDFFETSIATLTSALELSKKRYEYYRDEMMRF